MGFSCSFLHNQTYSADDVNRAFSRLTTQGVSLFAGEGNALTDLNTAVSNLIENGVDLFNNDACKVEKVIDGQYRVKPGTAFMPNGEMITVDADGYTFLVDTGTALNVIMEVNANIGQIRTTTESTPTNGILLATIEADGTVTDKRAFAKTKVAPASANVVQEVQIRLTNLTVGANTFRVDTNFAAFEYAVLNKYITGGREYQAASMPVRITDTLTEEQIYLFNPSDGTFGYARFKKEGSILVLEFQNHGSRASAGDILVLTVF